MLGTTLFFEKKFHDVDFDLMTPGQTLAAFMARCLTGLDEVLAHFQPDCLVAQGDTTTVMAAALAAFYRHVPFVHVEAGYLQSPWPEEMNRRMATLATTLHSAPTRLAANNLRAEGVAAESIHVTGNTVIDALLATVERERANTEHWQSAYSFLGNRRMVLITGHGRESFGEGFQRICQAIRCLADQHCDVEFLYPVHLNPQVSEPVRNCLGGHKNIQLSPPVSYPEFIWLMDRSTLILTDSGGVQEEVSSLGKPVLARGDMTERPEAIEAGVAELVGTSIEKIVRSVNALLTDPTECARRRALNNPYGDGHAAERIVDLIVGRFGR